MNKMKMTLALLVGLSLGLTSATSMAMDSKQQSGSVIGAVVGGIIGNQVGGGSGQVIATIIGVVAGSLIGSSIGESLDDMDRAALRDAQRDALYSDVGTVVPWRGADYGSRTGAHGRFQVMRSGHHRVYVQETCKTYRSEIQTRHKREVRSGTTCQRSNGSWYEVKSSEVRYY